MYKILGGDGKEYGPISADVLQQWVREGRANAQTQVLPAGQMAWITLGQLPEFSALFNAPASPAAFTSLPISPRRTNALAVTGFILSLVAITAGLCCCYGFPFNIAGIVCSSIGLVQTRKQPETYSGRGFAIAGLIIGILSILIGIALLAIVGVMGWADIQKELRNP